MFRLCGLGLPLAVLPSDFGHEEIAGIGDLEHRGRLLYIFAFMFFDMPEAGDDREDRGVVRILAIGSITVFHLVFLAIRESGAFVFCATKPSFCSAIGFTIAHLVEVGNSIAREAFLFPFPEIGIFIFPCVVFVVIEHFRVSTTCTIAVIGMGVAVELLVHGAAVELLRGDVVRIEGGEPVGEAVAII